MSLWKRKEPFLLFSIVVVFSLLRSMGINIIDVLSSPEFSEFLGNRQNIFNRFIVTGGWGWTLAIVSINTFVLKIVFSQHQWRLTINVFVRLSIATAVWWALTSLFDYIQFATGSCSDDSISDVVACKRQGLHWNGFDISGHTFLLMFSLLVIRVELPSVFECYPLDYQMWQVFIISIMPYLAIVLSYFYALMLVVTSLYFHVFWHKAFGAIFAWLGWLFVYWLASRLGFM